MFNSVNIQPAVLLPGYSTSDDFSAIPPTKVEGRGQLLFSVNTGLLPFPRLDSLHEALILSGVKSAHDSSRVTGVSGGSQQEEVYYKWGQLLDSSRDLEHVQ